MRDLLIITPTRERPGNAKRLLDAVAATATAQTDLIFAIDDDDSSYDDDHYRLPSWAEIIRGPHQGVVGWTNDIAMERAGEYRALASLGDDHVPITTGWDQRLLSVLCGRPGVSYGDDLNRGASLATSWVVPAPVIAALGYMGPPELTHLCMDLFIMQLGKDLGLLVYHPGAVIEHRHASVEKSDWDEVYRRANSLERYKDDWAAYSKFLAERWPGDLTRLREKLGVTDYD